MKQALFLALFALLVLTGVYTVITLYDSTLKAGRMYQTSAIRPYEEPELVMDNRTIAFGKSEVLIKEELKKETMKNVFHKTNTRSSQTMLAKGKKDYKSFCSHCHRPDLDGLGTVGQSFFPLPANLTGKKVTRLSDKELFTLISYGSKKSPALASSMTVESREAVIRYLRFVQKKTH